jgi:hypothetical protein
MGCRSAGADAGRAARLKRGVAFEPGGTPKFRSGRAQMVSQKFLRKFRNNRSSTDSQLIVSITSGWRVLGFKRPAIGAGLCHSFANSFQNFKA